jgi:hypothetical protein
MSSSKSFNNVVFNFAGIGVLLTAAGYMVTSYISTPAVLPCTARFPTGMQMSFDGAGGKPLTPVELQGRSGSREWGILKNAKAVKADGISGAALEVTLASTEDEDKSNQNGISFTWQPHQLATASAACLSYSVYLPPKFGFNEPGYLPGLFGAADVSQVDEIEPQDSFAARIGWAQAGDFGVDMRIPSSGGYWESAHRKTLWPTGRWVKIEQEVVLNTPGQEDGAMRVWFDGALTINNTGLTLRKNAQSPLSGVVSDIGYARTLSDVVAVHVSPFVLQWQ